MPQYLLVFLRFYYLLILINTCIFHSSLYHPQPTSKPTQSPSLGPSKEPTRAPSLSPIADPTQSPSTKPSESQMPSSQPSINPTSERDAFECMIFDTKPADELIQDTFLQNPEGDIQFQNVKSSNHSCFRSFYNGHKMGHNHETGVQLIPEEGIIMSTGIPEEFCWNDSDENTKKWFTDGDANLTSLLREENPTAVTYDACVIEFDFKCANVSSCLFVCV